MSNKLVTQLIVSRSESEREFDSEKEKRKNQLNSNRDAEGFHYSRNARNQSPGTQSLSFSHIL